MKPLFVLLIVYIALLAFGGHTQFDKGNIFAGNMAMSVMLLFTAIGHFKFKTSMAAMIPLFIPKKVEIIVLTGVLEILFAIGLTIVYTRYFTGIVLIVFLICLLPANIYAAKHRINYENLYQPGPGPKYLWFRIPFQFFLMAWVWYFSVR
ncbi:DoxX family protein [Pedobacter sp. GSP4]|uniref:DoxX family protein n=1 Tax=Pedobacter sp. GSP4 TaxID=3453716 RepID=UPI003EEF1988